MKKLLAVLLFALSFSAAFAQVPAPQVPFTGIPGVGGNFPFLNSGAFAMPADANYTVAYPNTTCVSCTVTSSVTLTATRVLTWPTGRYLINVCNYTTGSQGIEIAAPTGNPSPAIAQGSCAWVKFDGTNYVLANPSSGGATSFAGLSGVATPAQLPAATTTAQGAVQLPAGASSNVLGTAATQPSSAFDAAGSPIPADRITGLSSIVPAYTGDLATGVIGDYKFTDGSGTVLTDSSGLGNNGTFGNGVGSPTWVNSGVAFTGNVGIQLPTAINAARTIVMAMYYNPVNSTPLGTASTNINFSSVLTSQLGNSGGLNVSMNTAGSYGQPGNYRGGTVTQCLDTVVGYHVLGMTFGTGGGDLDHYYIDGQECSYGTQGASANAITSGNLYIGASNNTIWTNALDGTVYRMKVYSTELTAADQAVIAKLFNGEMASRGVPTSPVPIRTVSAEMECVGDSITVGATLTSAQPFCLGVQPLLLNQPAYVVNNWGLDGLGLLQIVPSELDRVARRTPGSAGGVHVATLFLGTNDMTLSGATPTETYSLLKAELAKLKGAQIKVFVGTMLSRYGEDANHDAYNDLIRTGIVAAGADGIIDFAANPSFGKDGAYAGACFSDQTHPDDACEPQMYTAVANTLNYYFGHHSTNPTIVTANNYTMTAADGFVYVQPTAATTLTLPDCTGQTGAVYTINNSQATYAVTLKNHALLASGFPAQTINGVDYSSSGTFTVPANGSVSLVDVALPLSTSGCVWQSR